MSNRLNVDRLAAVLSEILSDMTGADVRIRYVRKEDKSE